MDYYEELGVAPNANEEEIRRAHRRMTKLLHPDQQTDEGVKQLADVQMRRLNSIVDLLLDPEQRRDYDEQLREGAQYAAGPRLGAVKSQRRRRASWPWWVASTAAAIVLTVVVVWFWASNLGSSFGNRTPTYIPPDSKDAPASAAEVIAPTPAKSESAAVDPPTVVRAPFDPKLLISSPESAPPIQSAPEKHILTAQPQSIPAHKSLKLPKTQVLARAQPPQVDLPPPPGIGVVPTDTRLEAAAIPVNGLPNVASRPPSYPDPFARVSNADLLEGEWVYAPTEPEKKKAGFYPPEFIDLKLTRDDGRLHGQYRARYQVSDKPISPDVEFALMPDNDQNSFRWQSPNGSKGTFKISSVDPHVIRIEWRTTVYSHKPALTAGTATLVKRTE